MISRTILIWLFIGATWNTINLWLIFFIAKTIFSQAKNRTWIILLLFLKFPLLYIVGYLLLVYGNPSLGGLIFGFSLPLLIVFFRTVGRLTRSAQSDYDKEELANGLNYSAISRNIERK